ncbi:tumor necrosis factor receptor superfamily member 5 isoform X2 [Antennarius striatus]|uniref:tumor necrosis factor receptor superfamily member 5 isoform X2 n=1 Tax=Antennarius striatus TaxID=241820 RepID=UPI0035B0F111
MRPPRLLVLWVVTVTTAAQPRCDPRTQYELNGECCTMCGPGTSMSSLGTCLEPQCQPCGRKEYQDGYTREPKCQRQPYCDLNRNFLIPSFEITKRSVCSCKPGFHCSAEECITCVPHSTCEPGWGVRSRGNHSRDTVCQKCPKGTFSGENSSEDVCRNWTRCQEGQEVQQSGTAVSDSICVESSRTHTIVIVVATVSAFVGLLAMLLCYLCKGGRCDANAKGCIESRLGDRMEPLTDASAVVVTHPTDCTKDEFPPSQELLSETDDFMKTPVENEDTMSQEEATTGVLLTDRGNYVTQENGKSAVRSRQESQTV